MKRLPRTKREFWLSVMNRTSGAFSIHGPFTSEPELSLRIVTAQICGSDINCSSSSSDPDIARRDAAAAGLKEVADATRTPDLTGPWDVFSKDGDKVGKLRNALNFDLELSSPYTLARVQGDQVIDDGKLLGRVARLSGRISFLAS